ncbi:leucine-rich repeat-containing protein 71 [Salarias fasciatus]|uniref:leucine-rich repeat-containing protein 71 n=1 Tax=Salarias fasciatus TaxID=181472 RepID=UPI0011769523|nr:leucine-rich repeat-containing protein 71 [Salarias fasciatus]
MSRCAKLTEKFESKDAEGGGEGDGKKLYSANLSSHHPADEYRCSGNVEEDFPALCALLCIKDVPAVSVKQPASAEGVEKDTDNRSQRNAAPSWYKPRVEVMLENEGPLSAKRIKISGWKVNEQIFQVLLKMLPSVSQLLNLQFWQAGLTDPMVIALMNAVSLCSSLRVVMLEGNTLPEQSYHHLLSEDSPLAHLSLRNNRIGDEGARLIGSALSTATSTNKNLLSLSLAFNSIADEGASHIAQGLRLNRTLCFLSLSNNQIGDSGAARLAEVLGEFALTHEEVVERRKLLLQRTQSSINPADSPQSSVEQLASVPSSTSLSVRKSSAKKREMSKREEKQTANKDNQKSLKKSPDLKRPHSKGGKSRGKEKDVSAPETEVDTVNPLLDPSLYHRDGQLFLPGNSTLTSLNLAGNRITEKSLPLFRALLEERGEGRGRLRLALQRNPFPPECECNVKISELMALTDEANTPEPTREEGQEA